MFYTKTVALQKVNYCKEYFVIHINDVLVHEFHSSTTLIYQAKNIFRNSGSVQLWVCRISGLVRQKKVSERERGKRFVGWDTPLLHCGYPALSVLASDREAPRPAITRLPVCVCWCSMVVLPHTVGCISWNLHHIYQERALCYKGGHLLRLICCKVVHSPWGFVAIRRQLLRLTPTSS